MVLEAVAQRAVASLGRSGPIEEGLRVGVVDEKALAAALGRCDRRSVRPPRGRTRSVRPPRGGWVAQHMCTRVVLRTRAHRAGRQVDGGAEVEVRREQRDLVEPGVASSVGREREHEVGVDGVDEAAVQERRKLGGRARRQDGLTEKVEELQGRVVAEAESSQLRARREEVL